MNKKWNNSVLNYEAYSSFEGLSSDNQNATESTKEYDANNNHCTL